jgi:hypothetical protein
MLVPDDIVEKIYAAIPGAKLDSSQGGYTYPASAKVPQLSFAVGNAMITIDETSLACLYSSLIPRCCSRELTTSTSRCDGWQRCLCRYPELR